MELFFSFHMSFVPAYPFRFVCNYVLRSIWWHTATARVRVLGVTNPIWNAQGREKKTLIQKKKWIKCPHCGCAFQKAVGCPLWYLPGEQNSSAAYKVAFSKGEAIIQTYALNPVYTDIMPPKLPNSFPSPHCFRHCLSFSLHCLSLYSVYFLSFTHQSLHPLHSIVPVFISVPSFFSFPALIVFPEHIYILHSRPPFSYHHPAPPPPSLYLCTSITIHNEKTTTAAVIFCTLPKQLSKVPGC